MSFMSRSYWWSWRHWRSHCLAMGGLSPRCPSLRPPPGPHHCRHTGPACHHTRSGCWRWSWRSGCGREGSLQRGETRPVMTYICNAPLFCSLPTYHRSPRHVILLYGFSFTNFDREAWRQAQGDEVTQLRKQGVGDGHEVNDRGHLFRQGEGMGLAQPQLGFKPGKDEWQWNAAPEHLAPSYMEHYVFTCSIIKSKCTQRPWNIKHPTHLIQ